MKKIDIKANEGKIDIKDSWFAEINSWEEFIGNWKKIQ